MKKKWYHPIRYEYQRWPLSRLDLDLAYICKSIDHMDFPNSPTDLEHYSKMNRWLKEGSWRAYDQSNSVHVCAVGDIMWIRSGWHKALSNGVKNTLKQADITLANLETPIDPAQKVPKWVYETFHYNAPLDYFSCWHELQPDSQHVFSICNNHALDKGPNGLDATRSSILQQGSNFYCLGGPNKKDESTVLMVKGIKMGFMASTFAINHATPEKPPAGIPIHLFGNPLHEPDWNAISERIAELKEQGAEYIVYTPHWGYEYEYWPDEIQRKHAIKLIELGVDVILGHSPHVLQPIELISINNKDKNCPLQIERPGGKGFGIIVWSLGNFLTIMPTVACKTGVVLQLDLVKKSDKIQIKNIELIPVYTTRPKGGQWLDRQVMCLNELPGNKAALRPKILNHCQGISPLISTGDYRC